jgi:hypothetical protein
MTTDLIKRLTEAGERKAELAETAAENIDRSSIYGRIEIRDMLLEYAALLRAPQAKPVVDDAMVRDFMAALAERKKTAAVMSLAPADVFAALTAALSTGE